MIDRKQGQPVATHHSHHYMSMAHLDFFRSKLINWQQELTSSSRLILEELSELNILNSDPLDYSYLQTRRDNLLIQVKRNEETLLQIAHALKKINRSEYGYCEWTGEEIGIERLKVVPLATLCLEAQEDMERKSRRLQRLQSKRI